MNLKKILLPLWTLCVIGCSSDSEEVLIDEESDVIAPVDLIVIGENIDTVFQFTYDADADAGQMFDLTEEIGVSTDYLTLRQVNDELTFYSFSQGAFSLAQINVNTRATANFNDFFANSAGRSVTWGTNNSTNVFFGFFGPNGTRNFGIQDVSLQGTETTDVTIDFDIDTTFPPLFYDDKVYFTYINNQGEHKFTFYNAASQSAGPVLDFGDVPISFLVSETGDIAIIENGTSPRLKNYDPESLILLDEMPLAFGTALNQGPLEGAILENNTLFYARPTIQPAQFFAEPAIFDLVAQDGFFIDLETIAVGVEEETGGIISISTMIYSASRNMFLLGYGLLGNPSIGGVLQISPDGQLVKNIALSFLPTDFVKD